MSLARSSRVAILYPGDRESRDRSDPKASRFAALFDAFAAAGLPAEPAIYNDDFAEEVRAQLLAVDAVLVWHNPIEGGRTRTVLDALLRDVAAGGVFVSAHPDTILALGTKDVLLAVRDTPFGSDAHRVGSLEALREDVRERLRSGPRVLKQHRGHSGIGVWRVEGRADGRYLVRHAQRGSREEVVDRYDDVVSRLAQYFEHGGHMIDQAWQPLLVEGITRAYLVGDRVAGFGHQAVNALYPAVEGGEPPAPGPRLYSGPDDERFQRLRGLLEDGWVSLLESSVGLAHERLPLLWDADFMRGEGDRYVLCEINVSSVAPFPDSATLPIVDAVRRTLSSHR